MPQPRREAQVLPRCEHAQEDLVLLQERDARPRAAAGVDGDDARRQRRALAQRVEQRRLARAARAHQREHAPGDGAAVGVDEDLLGAGGDADAVPDDLHRRRRGVGLEPRVVGLHAG